MLSMTHMIIVFIVVLVVFGPQKLPELARGLGKLMAEFRKASTDFRNAFEHEMRDLERQALQVERKKAAEASNPSTSATQSTAAQSPAEAADATNASTNTTQATAAPAPAAREAEATSASAGNTEPATPSAPAGAEASTATPEASSSANEGPVVTSVPESVPRSYEQSSRAVSETEPVSAESSIDPAHDHQQPA